MKYVNLTYLNWTFAVVGVIVVVYAFSVTFLSPSKIQDQLISVEVMDSPQELLLRDSGDNSSESSMPRRRISVQPGSTARSATEARTPSNQTSTGRAPANIERARGISRSSPVGSSRITADQPRSGTVGTRQNSTGARRPDSGFVVTPSQGASGAKRSAPRRSQGSSGGSASGIPPVQGSMAR